MQQFETLLLRQLQKQQNRDEFCDTVLHTQGVSVPVHSCVLSAFSPRFYGTLSSMPVPMAGQRRLIELQAVDGCTLLSLVSLLYSGQLQENREQVLSAAQRLGIELPQWEEEERHEGKVGRRKAREDADQEKKIESGTQTEREEKTDERGAQTDLASSKPQTMYLINPSTCPANQELGSCVEIQDVALPLQVIHPEKKSITCDSSAMAPGTEDSHPVTESAHLSQICLYSSETSHHQTSTSVTLHPHTSILDQSVVVPAAGPDALNDLKQFEGNIPGFINYFLASTESPNIGRRGQGCAKEGLKEERVVKSSRAKSTARDSGREWIRWTAGVKGGRRQRHMERWGLVARLAWRGQGGGKVGRLLETRSTGKNRMRALQRRQVREALVEAGAARGRGRHRQRGKTGTVAGSEKQNDPPSKRRSSGRPRLTPLPAASRSFSTTTTTMQNTVDTSELDLLHTLAPVPVNQIEPIDTLLEDIMTGLNFLPPEETQNNQHGLMSTTTSSGPPIFKASNSKPTDPKQHMEGELGDILDHFLRTFDQQVGCCGLDVGGETSQGSYKPDSGRDTCSNTSKTFTQQQPYNPHINNQKPQANCLHTSCTLSTQPQSMVNSSVAKKDVKDGQKRGSKQRNPSRVVQNIVPNQNIVQEFENRRLTRSQTIKRKLEIALFTRQTPVKRKCNEKESADTKKKRQSDDQKRPKYMYVDKISVKKLKGSQKQVRAGERRQRETRFSRNKSVKNRSCRMDDCKQKKSPPQKRRGNNGCRETKRTIRGNRVESDSFQAGQSSVKSQTEGPCIGIASSAMEKVKMLLQLQDENENKRASPSVGIHWEKNAGNRRLVKHQGFSGAEGCSEEIPEAKDEERINVNGTVKGQERVNYKVKLRQRREDSRRTGDRARQEEESSVPFQLNLPTDTGKRNSYIFHLPKEGIEDTKASISTTESVAKVLDAWPGGPVSAEVKLPFTQSIMLRMTDLSLDVGDAPQLASASRLSHTQPRQELLRSLTSVDDEEEDVDVVEVSSPTSELPAVSILEVDLSTEDEVEEDCEIDVLGLDSPCRTASANLGLHTVPRPAEI